jgi:hypothetical protein
MASHDAAFVASVCGKAHPGHDGGFMALCPAHDDRNPSLSINQTDEGTLLVKCFAGCSQEAVLDRLKALIPDFDPRADRLVRALRENGPKIKAPVGGAASQPDIPRLLGTMPSAIYTYRDANGKVLGYQCRINLPAGKKKFQPVTSTGSKWAVKGFGSEAPLYGLDKLAAHPSAPVLMTEGEKAADAAQLMFPDYAVVTWPNGAAAVGKVDLTPLEGRDVTIWPDADKPGFEAAAKLSTRLRQEASVEAKVVLLPKRLPEGWDLADEPPAGFDPVQAITLTEVFDDTLARYVRSARDIAAMNLPPREYIVEPWLATNSLSLIFARRGVGKTWVALALAKALALGENFLCYPVDKEWRVLFWDGEMTLTDIKVRLGLIGAE